MQTNDTTTTGTDQLDDGRTIEGGITVVEEKLDHALVVTNPAQYAKILFEPFFAELTSARRKAGSTKYDITTPAGMAAAKALSDTFVKIRTRADKAKVEAKKPIDQSGKIILTEYERLATAAKAEQEKHDKAIAEEKARLAKIEEDKRNAERVRIEAIEARLAHIRSIPGRYAKADAATLQTTIDELLAKQLDPALYDEHLEAAAAAMIETVDGLRELHAAAIKAEAEAAELARLRAEEEQRKAAAAAMQAQQEQMAAIMEMQGMAGALAAAGKTGDREAVEAAVAKARAFDPAAFGAMAPMASLARDAALPLLEDLLANLPAPVVIGVDPAAPGADSTVVAPIEADHTGVVIGAAVLSSERVPASDTNPLGLARVAASTSGRLLPKAHKPHDLDILALVAHHYDVPNDTAIAWLATFDADKARADLAAA